MIMKHSKKHMIAVVMDDIRDTDMIAGYAEEAKAADDGHANWFAMRAKERLNTLRRDWSEVDAELHLHNHDDDLVNAMACHIGGELDRIKARVDKL